VKSAKLHNLFSLAGVCVSTDLWRIGALVYLAAGPIFGQFRTPPWPRTPPEAIGRAVSRADAIADLKQMMRTFEAVHPNLYAVRSREATSGEREKLEAGLPESMTRVEWWARLSRFVAGFGDGHFRP
jgi:hypothetical protein